jgi:small subunit ribosomal protein S21
MTHVVRRDGESFKSMLKRFRKKVARSRILSTVKKKRYFTSSAEERRKAERKAVRRERKRQRRERRKLWRA